MARPSAHPVHPRDLIVNVLKKSKKPMTAYALLDALKPKGISAPPVIYRALDSLAKQGQVHKIKELSAYILCDCHADHDHALSVLTVCNGCQEVKELHDHSIIHHLEDLRKKGVRLTDQAVIELPITCDACAA